MKSNFARDASTALNWADPTHRASIGENLRTNAEVLAAEILNAKSSSERIVMLTDLQRVYTRLAVCDIDKARTCEDNIETERNRDTLCRITLEKMSDMMDEADHPDKEYARNFVVMGKAFARLIGKEGLADFFSTGPYSGLGRFALTIPQCDVDKMLKERDAMSAICKMARMIPVTQSVDAEEIEAQVFRDGLTLFRRHQGLEKYPFEK